MAAGTFPRRWLVLVLTGFLVVSISGAAIAAEFAGDEIYRLAAGEVVEDDLYVAGSEIYIDGTVKGDLIVGGGYIEISSSGVVEGDLLAAGGGIVVNGTVQDDVRAAGGGIEISGTVADDAIIAGGGGQFAFPIQTGSRSIQPGMRIGGQIGGDAVVAGGGADVSGEIGGNFFGGLGLLDLSGTVDGDANIEAGEMRIDGDARIGGILTYRAQEQKEFPAGVSSDIRFERQAQEEDQPINILGVIFGWILRTVAILIGIALVGWLLLRFAPSVLARPVAAIQAKPVETGLYGLAAAALLIFIPIASIVLVAFVWTFWGVFPGLVMFAFLFASLALLWFLSPLVTGLWLGESISQRMGSGFSPVVALLLGALLVVVLGRIPVLGWLIYLVSFVLALGGFLRGGMQADETPPPAQPVSTELPAAV